MSKDYVIGMDGGGTRTSVLIADLKHRELDRFIRGSINYNGNSKAQVDTNLKDILNTVQIKGYRKEDCKAICIGAAGISNPDVKEFMLDNIRKSGYLSPVTLVGDQEAALYGALDTSFGIILISGTGSICYGKDQKGNTYRTGGFGHLIDDGGSGYAIGRDILTAVVRAYDGRGEATLLTELIYQSLQINEINQLIAYLYQQNGSKKDIARLAPIIEEACARQDTCALEIIKKNAGDLTDLVRPVVRAVGEGAPLAVSGSVLLHNRYLYEGFTEAMSKLYPDVSVFRAKNPAEDGAVTLALALMNKDNSRHKGIVQKT